MDLNFNTVDVKILEFLLSNKERGISPNTALTIDEIINGVNISLSDSRIRASVSKLIKLDMINTGIKSGRKITYYITAKSVDFLKNIEKTII